MNGFRGLSSHLKNLANKLIKSQKKMLALSPTCFSTFGWPTLDDPVSHDLTFDFGDQTAESILNFPPNDTNYNNYTPNQLQQDIGVDYNSAFSGDMVKKLNHNASERHRRKKINTLYSSLRSLLPAPDQMKKLSIPTTVSRVVKYIPELQQQVERLTQKKEELLSKIARQDGMSSNNIHDQDHQRKPGSMNSSSFLVSTNRLSDGEVVVQISTSHKNVHKCPLLSELLVKLEEDGLVLMNSSSFESSETRVFYNLHLQAKEGSDARLEFEGLSEKLVSLYGNKNPG